MGELLLLLLWLLWLRMLCQH